MLALNLAQHQGRCSELPTHDYLSLAGADTLTAETATTLADGMAVAVGIALRK